MLKLRGREWVMRASEPELLEYLAALIDEANRSGKEIRQLIAGITQQQMHVMQAAHEAEQQYLMAEYEDRIHQIELAHAMEPKGFGYGALGLAGLVGYLLGRDR